MVKEGLINLDFADVRAVMGEMGKGLFPWRTKNRANRRTAPIP
jgi:cell division GTPase FtsZ